MARPAISVLIPAHDEAAVIARALRPLAEAAEAGRVEVIVIANGCTDGTERMAQDACPAATVLSLRKASKVIALNAGARRATGQAIVCLDADLELSETALLALVRPVLAGGAQMACGTMVPLTDAATLPVRMFYRGWMLSPYFDGGKAGGVIALSAGFAAQVLPLRAFTSDDELLARQADPRWIVHARDARFTVHAPRDLRALVAIRKRSRRGTARLEKAGFATARPSNAKGALVVLGRALRRPARLADVAVYFAVIVWVRMLLSLESPGHATRWERDESSRATGGPA